MHKSDRGLNAEQQSIGLGLANFYRIDSLPNSPRLNALVRELETMDRAADRRTRNGATVLFPKISSALRIATKFNGGTSSEVQH